MSERTATWRRPVRSTFVVTHSVRYGIVAATKVSRAGGRRNGRNARPGPHMSAAGPRPPQRVHRLKRHNGGERPAQPRRPTHARRLTPPSPPAH
eukprot:3598470-Prymnesium_polylepis.1